MLHLSDVLRLFRHCIVFPGKPQRLLETGVLLARHQETQTQIGEPDGDAFPHGLDTFRHGRGDKLDGICLVVGLGGQDERLATQVLISAGGDVRLDGLAALWRIDAEGCVLLGGLWAVFGQLLSC